MTEHMWKHNNEISCWYSKLFLEQEIVNSLFAAGTGSRPDCFTACCHGEIRAGKNRGMSR